MKYKTIPFLAFFLSATVAHLSANNWVEFDPLPDNETVIDTGSFLGLLDIANDPFVFSFKLNQYVFVPENARHENGRWVRIKRRDPALYFPTQAPENSDD